MSDTNHLDPLYYKNQIAIARWKYRWAQQGGSFFHVAHSLEDLRDIASIFAWREIEFLAKAKRGWAKRAHERVYGKLEKKVVNLTALRFDRVRQAAKRIGMGAVRT